MILPAESGYPAGSGDNKVGGTGTIIPHAGIVTIAGVPGFAIKKIFVHAGDTVKQGTPLFELDSVTVPYDLAVVSNEVETNKKDAEYRNATEALTLKLLDARLQHAKRDAANYRAVGASGISEREVSRLQQAVEENQMNLDIEKVRAQQLQYDLAMSLRSATTRLESATSNLAHFTVRAPNNGTILKLNRREGEYASGEPVMEFGDLSAMYVDAQVYQGDMVKVRPGMKVTVKNSAFPNLATGKVETVGRLIGTRSQLGDVMIRLDKNDPADRLVGMEVEVVIGP